jgi:hypothetical protein
LSGNLYSLSTRRAYPTTDRSACFVWFSYGPTLAASARALSGYRGSNGFIKIPSLGPLEADPPIRYRMGAVNFKSESPAARNCFTIDACCWVPGPSILVIFQSQTHRASSSRRVCGSRFLRTRHVPPNTVIATENPTRIVTKSRCLCVGIELGFFDSVATSELRRGGKESRRTKRTRDLTCRSCDRLVRVLHLECRLFSARPC